RYAERGYECTRPRHAGMVPAWINGVEARWTQERLREGQRDAAMNHFARAETDYRTAVRLGYEPGAMQSELAILYALVGKPAEARGALERAEAIDYVDVTAAVPVARAYVAQGRCGDVERIVAKAERALGTDGPAGELRGILGTCAGRPGAASR